MTNRDARRRGEGRKQAATRWPCLLLKNQKQRIDELCGGEQPCRPSFPSVSPFFQHEVDDF